MVYLIALISIILGSMAQYFLKVGMNKITIVQDTPLMERGMLMLTSIPLWGGLFCYGLSMFFWLYVLAHMELSRAYPLVSLGYVFTLILGYFMLGETLTLLKITGVLLIIGGVFFISK